ncbi:hypothetical protein D918_00892 [Trichuris suis]|nr:hypothetical protein D918_00892 [Trichuris suis]
MLASRNEATVVVDPSNDAASNVPLPKKRISVLKNADKNTTAPEKHHVTSLSQSRIFQNAECDEEEGPNNDSPMISRAVVKDFKAAAKAREELVKTVRIQQHYANEAEVKSLVEMPSKEEQWEFAAGFAISDNNERSNQVSDGQTVTPSFPVLKLCEEQLKMENQLYYCAESGGNEIAIRSTDNDQKGRHEAMLSKNNLCTLEKRLMNEGKEARNMQLAYEPNEEKFGKFLSTAPMKVCIDEGAPTAPWVHCEYAKKNDSSKAGVSMFELVITLSKLMFTHHSLFSKEDVLCRRLLELYNIFQSRLRDNLSYHYAQQLALVRTRFHEYKMLRQTSDDESVAEKENKLEMLLNECRELRRRRNEEEAKDHLLLQKIVSTWNNIKRLRKAQRYTTTSFKLTLQKYVPPICHFFQVSNVRYEVDAESDRDAWKIDLLDDLEERECESKEKQGGLYAAVPAFGGDRSVKTQNTCTYMNAALVGTSKKV